MGDEVNYGFSAPSCGHALGAASSNTTTSLGGLETHCCTTHSDGKDLGPAAKLHLAPVCAASGPPCLLTSSLPTCCPQHGAETPPGPSSSIPSRARSSTHLWFVRLPGVGCVQLSEDTLGFGKKRLLFVNVVDPGLSAPKHQDHWTRLQAWGRDGGSCHSPPCPPRCKTHPYWQPQRPVPGACPGQMSRGNTSKEEVLSLGSPRRGMRFWRKKKNKFPFFTAHVGKKYFT